MQYFGGKQRIAKRVADYLNTFQPKVYLEPFCGSCNVGVHVTAEHKIFCDLHPKLIAMWQALMDGWEPPEFVSEEEWYQAKDGKLSDHLTGFIGFACSFSGRYFEGYARSVRGYNYARGSHNSLLRKVKALKGSEFVCCDYHDAFDAVTADLVYCDPPYVNTKPYSSLPPFEHDPFWDAVRFKSVEATTLVSEYVAPLDFYTKLEIKTNTRIRGNNGQDDRTEKLYSWL